MHTHTHTYTHTHTHMHRVKQMVYGSPVLLVNKSNATLKIIKRKDTKWCTYNIVLHDAILIHVRRSVRAYARKGVVPRILTYTVGITVLWGTNRKAFLMSLSQCLYHFKFQHPTHSVDAWVFGMAKSRTKIDLTQRRSCICYSNMPWPTGLYSSQNAN